MLKRLILTLFMASAMAVSAVAQTSTSDVSLAGVITKVERDRIEIRTDNRETRSVSLSSETRYLKWIMAKPWQQDARADARSLRPGRRVHVNLDRKRGDPESATTVWIVVGRPGFD